MLAKNRAKVRITLFFLVIAVAYSYSWTYTTYGRLDYPVALSLHLFSFSHKYQPDPDIEFSVTIPANLAFMTDLILPKEAVKETKDIKIPGKNSNVPVRIYWPEHFNKSIPSPIIVFIHGGGFMLANIDIYDRLTRTIANDNNSIVISVEYRLTPANPFPAGLDDSYAVVEWAEQYGATIGGDPTKLVVAGDSAGGNLSTVIAQKAKNENGPAIAAQILYYPVVDLSNKYYDSYKFMDGYGGSKELSDSFHQAYIGHLEDKTTPYASPLYADNLAGLPPTLIFTAGFDPLTDATLLYVKKLQKADVEVTAIHYPSTIHGFMSVPVFSQRHQALQETERFLSFILN